MQSPRPAIHQAYFAPLTRPAGWLPLIWGLVEIIYVMGAFSAGWQGRGEHWYWLTVFAVGLSFWPLMAARWRAGLQVVLLYKRPGMETTGLLRAWSTPQQAGSLNHTLQGKIDWGPPPAA